MRIDILNVCVVIVTSNSFMILVAICKPKYIYYYNICGNQYKSDIFI